MSKRFLFLLLGVIALTGCNLPMGSASTPTEVVPPDAVFTAAAETLAAQLSPTATVSQPEQPTATLEPPTVDTPTVEAPTQTSEPTTTPTITPSPTATESPEPTEIPEVLFFDDFSESDWYTYDEGENYGFKYTSEGYHIYNNIKMGIIWSIREQEFSSVGLEVSGTRLDGPSDSYFGVVCNFSDDGDNYYALVIGDDGFYGLALMEDGEYEFLESGVDENNFIQQGQGQTNRIRAVCNGGHFLIYANGELLLDTWDDTLTEGIVGLAVGNKRTGGQAEFRFNDFAITRP